MNSIKRLTFATLAALAGLLIQPSTRADNHGRGNDDKNKGERGEARATFTKWVIGGGPFMEGVVGGDVGPGSFTGKVLQFQDVPGPGGVTVRRIEAIYNFKGSKYSFTALVHVEQTGSGNGSKAVIIGVVTDGWRKGQAIDGNYTQVDVVVMGVTSPTFKGALEINDRKN